MKSARNGFTSMCRHLDIDDRHEQQTVCKRCVRGAMTVNSQNSYCLGFFVSVNRINDILFCNNFIFVCKHAYTSHKPLRL